MKRFPRLLLALVCAAVLAGSVMPAFAADANQVLLWAGSPDGSSTTLTIVDLTSSALLDQWTYAGAQPSVYFPDQSPPSSITPSNARAQVYCYDSGNGFVTFTVVQPNGTINQHQHPGHCPASGHAS